MFLPKDLGKDVRIMFLDGSKLRGTVTEVHDDRVVLAVEDPAEEREIEFNAISTVTRIGEFGGE